MTSPLELMVWGLQDAWGPLPLTVLGLFFAFCLAVASEKKALSLTAPIFLLTVFSLSLSNYFGLLSFLLMFPVFLEIVRWFFVLLGAGMVMIGARFFIAWMAVRREPAGKYCRAAAILPLPAGLRNRAVIVILAIVVSTAMMVWPPQVFITMIINDAFLPGKLWGAVAAVALYQLFKMTPLLCAILLAVLIESQGKPGSGRMLSRSMTWTLLSGAYIALGLSVIYFAFKQLV